MKINKEIIKAKQMRKIVSAYDYDNLKKDRDYLQNRLEKVIKSYIKEREKVLKLEKQITKLKESIK